MMKYLYVCNVRIPSYGMIVVAGIVLCNFVAQQIVKKDVQRIKEFYSVEIISGIGAVIGAKVLTILTGFVNGSIGFFTWENIKEVGYSFYGGLAGFFFFGFIGCKVIQADGLRIVEEYLFLLPLLHCIWKIGCFMGGCCYGVPYDGPCAVCYEEGVNSVPGIRVFPIQLLEAIVSLLTMTTLVWIKRRKSHSNIVGIYLIMYGVTRFFLEFLRYHEIKTILSDGQVCSLVCGCIGLIIICRDYRRKICDE